MNANSRTVRQQRGFTLMQMVITIAIIAIVTTFGVLGIKTARAEFRLQNSARLFATYVEKARADSIRRHAGTGQEASVETFDPGTANYAISMDYGAGTIETRPKSMDYRFKLKNGDYAVVANYTGIVPDTFKDGAEVVLTGRLGPQGFQASDMTAKCPSKYEASGLTGPTIGR